MFRFLFLCLTIFVICGCNDSGKDLNGVVKTDSGILIKDVSVKIDTKETSTDKNGYYKFSGITDGEYEITFTKWASGYGNEKATILIPDIATYDITMRSSLFNECYNENLCYARCIAELENGKIAAVGDGNRAYMWILNPSSEGAVIEKTIILPAGIAAYSVTEIKSENEYTGRLAVTGTNDANLACVWIVDTETDPVTTQSIVLNGGTYARFIIEKSNGTLAVAGDGLLARVWILYPSQEGYKTEKSIEINALSLNSIIEIKSGNTYKEYLAVIGNGIESAAVWIVDPARPSPVMRTITAPLLKSGLGIAEMKNDGIYKGYLAVCGKNDKNDASVTLINPYGNDDVATVNRMTWAYGGDAEDCTNGITETSDGKLALTGYTKSDNADLKNVTRSNNYDLWLFTLDPYNRDDLNRGKILFNKCYGGSENDYGYGIIQTADGCFAVCARTGSEDKDLADPGSGAWIFKINSDGKYHL